MVDEFVEGPHTGWSDGRLRLLATAAGRGQLAAGAAEITVEVVRPGDSVRISNVLDGVLPTARIEGARRHRFRDPDRVPAIDPLPAADAS